VFELEAVTISLNGREVSGHSGMTVLELARESGVDIPTLCYDPYLSRSGTCRICVVEDETSNKLLASCVAPIAPGMVIHTHSSRVIEHRKTIIKLVLASHPDSCLVCDKGNRCQLRQIAADMGIGLPEFERIPQMAAIEEVNPFIVRDFSKCILCAKCIRACQELVVQGAIDYFQRGFIAKAATLGDLPLEDSECTFCGTCVALCPTGALMEKEKIYRGTTKATVQTTCPFCGCGCGVSLEVKDNSIVRAVPSRDTAVNRGTLCVKGSYGYDFIHSPDRLTKPLAKANDSFEEVSWEQALEMTATELGRIKREYGPDSLAVLGCSKCTNEENYLLQRFTRCVLGTNNIDNGGRLYNSATQIGFNASIGVLSTTNCFDALEQSEVIIVIGSDPASSAPIVEYAIKRAVKYRGAKLILIDPRRTNLSSFAHLWLRPRVGTDVALLNSLAKVIIDEGLLNKEFVEQKTDNLEALAKAVKKYSPEYSESITGVPSEQIRDAAQLYATATQATIIYGTGITQYTSGVQGVKALANLAMLTGNIRREGGGIYALQRENNSRGANDMGALPNFLPGYQSVADAQARRKFEKCWQTSLPAAPGLTAVEIIEQVKAGKIKGLYVVGENPILSFPHYSLVTETLASLDFLVVQDMFLTETAKLATVVLPAASFAEKEGTFTNFEGRINTLRQAIAPVWQIILRLADRMGSPLPFSSVKQVTDEIDHIVPLYKGYADSGKLNEVEWEFAHFAPVKYVPQERADGDYPLILLTGSTLHHLGTGTRSSRAWRLTKFSPQDFVEIGEFDAQKLAITDGDKVKIISPIGEVVSTVKTSDTLPDGTTVKISDTLPEGMLFMPVSFPQTPVTKLFGINLDPEAKTPALKACSVRIEKAGSNE